MDTLNIVCDKLVYGDLLQNDFLVIEIKLMGTNTYQ